MVTSQEKKSQGVISFLLSKTPSKWKQNTKYPDMAIRHKARYPVEQASVLGSMNLRRTGGFFHRQGQPLCLLLPMITGDGKN